MTFNPSATMAKEFKLPMVAGTSCGEEMMRRNFRKTQVFGAKVDRATKTQGVPLDFTKANADFVATATANMSAASGSGNGSPDEKPESLSTRVLRFYGYSREAVHESHVEKERIRKIVLCYFLEDGTLSITEPRKDNSGFAFQGTVVKRHVVPQPDGQPLQLNQIAVNATVTVYSRVYIIVDADAFTRKFYESLGAPLEAASEYPDDAYTAMRARPVKAHDVPSIASTSALNITLSSAQIRATQQFLANDRQVLRCDCTWNDTKALYGEVHYLTLYYFLADDNIAVVEKDGVNTGRDPFPNFVKRQRIPKPRNSRFENTTSSLTFASKDAQSASFYCDEDIRIGNVLNLFGRNVRICDYDKFTRDYLREKFGLVDYAPIDTSVPVKPKAVREPPPYNGFGDEDDSLGSCQRLDIKPPRKDGAAFAKHGGNSVKYLMKLENGIATDDIRKFVLTCFLADKTICIFEPVQRNSGIVGGKFLQRQKVNGPNGKPYVAGDFFVGCHTVINGFPFVVVATDERSLSYMEQNSSDFTHSNVNYIVGKMQAMLVSASSGLADALYEADKASGGAGGLDFAVFAAIAARLGLDLSEQEILTVLRYFDRNGESSINYEEFVARLMPEGSVVGQDPREWRAVHDDASNAELDKLSVVDKVAAQKAKVVATTAAYGARAFLELYQQRRALFHSEFKFICDYAVDGKIGEAEFRKCVVEKLRLALADDQIDALCEKLFPAGARRVSYEELLRLFNNSSNFTHNLAQIKARR